LASADLLSQEQCYIHSGNQLYSLDYTNCNKQFIGVTGTILTDIALTPSGNLYGVDFYNFYKINTSNGMTTLISSIDAPGAGFNSLVGYNNEYVLAVRIDGGLYKIHTATGDTSLIGALGYYPSGDITFYKGYYYMADAMNQLIRFKLDFDNEIISNIEMVGTMNTLDNAVYGVVTIGDANCQEVNLQILAFEGTTVYTVDPENANCTVLCPSTSSINAYGAASSVETMPQVLDGILEMPNIFTPNNDGINDFFSPSIMLGISSLEGYIANRWGNIIYIQGQSSNLMWNGKTEENQICTEGTYFYNVIFTDFCNNKKVVKGFVQLVK
jgi:gliding motility-associated-like protein